MKKIFLTIAATTIILAACNNNQSESSIKADNTTAVESKQERNKKIVMESFEMFMKGDYNNMFKDAAPGFVDYTDGSMPPITNLDSLKNFLMMMTTAIEGYKGENLQYYTDGDYVLVHGDWVGTFKNDLMGIKATGKPVKFKDVDIFKLNDEGKITEHSSVQNIGAVLVTAGMQK